MPFVGTLDYKNNRVPVGRQVEPSPNNVLLDNYITLPRSALEDFVHNRNEVIPPEVWQEWVEINQILPDSSVFDNKIYSLSVAKLAAGTITSKAITLAVEDGTGDVYIAAGKTDFTNTDAGFILGIDDSDSDTPKFYIGDSSNYLNWDGTSLTIAGSLIAGSIHIPDEDTTANSFHVESDGDTFWGCTQSSFTSDNDNANAYVLKTGAAKFQSVVLTTSVVIDDLQAGSNVDGQYLTNDTVTSAKTKIALMGWSNDLVFSATDYRIAAWASGTITMSDGATTYSITAGNTGNMAALTYIYLDIGASVTVLQTSTTATDAVGDGKILIAVAENNADTTADCSYQVFGGTGGNSLLVDNIAANSASTNEFVSNTAQVKDAIITNAKINDLNVNKLTAGTITSKAVTLAIDPGNGDVYFNAGKTDFTNVDTGFILGIDDSDSDTPKFYIGSSTSYLNWDGSGLTIEGTINGRTFATDPIYGDGSDGNVTINANTTLTADMFYDNLTIDATYKLDTGGFRVFVADTLTINGRLTNTATQGTSGTNGGGGASGAGGGGGTGGSGGPGGAAGVTTSTNTVSNGVASAAGSAGGAGGGFSNNGTAGTAGVNGTNLGANAVGSSGVAGEQGGAGGDGGDGPGPLGGNGAVAGAASTGGTATAAVSGVRHTANAAIMIDTVATYAQYRSSASSGSGSGGGGGGGGAVSGLGKGGGGGGGGGAGGTGGVGGIVMVAAKDIVIGAAGTMNANGGDGGDGGDGGGGGNGDPVFTPCGGGGGGGGGAGGSGGVGGVLVYIYQTLSNSGTIEAASNGGAAGAKGTGGAGTGGAANGDDGVAGTAGAESAGVVIALIQS